MSIDVVPPVDAADPATRLLRAILGYCPECEQTDLHEHGNPDRNRHMTTGDDLITCLVNADSLEQAIAIADAAPVGTVYQAADLLYIDADSHSIGWIRKNVAAEARA